MQSVSRNDHCADRAILALPAAYHEYLVTLMTSHGYKEHDHSGRSMNIFDKVKVPDWHSVL